MARIYERLLSKNIPRKKRQNSFDPQRVNLLGEESMCMVNLLVIPQKIVAFFYYMIDFSSDVSPEKFCFVKRAYIYVLSPTVLALWVAPPEMFCNWYRI